MSGEKEDSEMLQRSKMQRKRFIILEPDINTGLSQDNIPQKLKMYSYEALVPARLHAGRLKGKYQFIFDLNNPALQQAGADAYGQFTLSHNRR